jgi:hypothetical protein
MRMFTTNFHFTSGTMILRCFNFDKQMERVATSKYLRNGGNHHVNKIYYKQSLIIKMVHRYI